MPPIAPVWLDDTSDHLVLRGARAVVEVEQPRLAVLGHLRRAVGDAGGHADRQATISAPSRASVRADSGNVLS